MVRETVLIQLVLLFFFLGFKRGADEGMTPLELARLVVLNYGMIN